MVSFQLNFFSGHVVLSLKKKKATSTYLILQEKKQIFIRTLYPITHGFEACIPDKQSEIEEHRIGEIKLLVLKSALNIVVIEF